MPIIIDIPSLFIPRKSTSTNRIVEDVNPNLLELLQQLEEEMGPTFKGCPIHICYNSATDKRDLELVRKALCADPALKPFFASCKFIDGQQNDGSYRLTVETLQKSLKDSSLTPKKVILITDDQKLIDQSTELVKQSVKLYGYGQLNTEDVHQFELQKKVNKDKPLFSFSDIDDTTLLRRLALLENKSIINQHMVEFYKQHNFKECTLITARQNPYNKARELLYPLRGMNATLKNYDSVIPQKIEELSERLTTQTQEKQPAHVLEETRQRIISLQTCLSKIQHEIEKGKKSEKDYSHISVPKLMENFAQNGIKFCNDSPIYTNKETSGLSKIDVIYHLVTTDPKYKKSIIAFTDDDPDEVSSAILRIEEFAQLGITLVVINSQATASYDNTKFEQCVELVNKAATSKCVDIMSGKSTQLLPIKPPADENNMNVLNFTNSTLPQIVSTMSTTP